MRKLLTLLTLSLLVGCSSDGKSDKDNSENGTSNIYSFDTVSVDYKGANNVVFYDFSEGVETTTAHDIWDIAFDKNYNFIANGGEYGYGVLVCNTGKTDFNFDFSTWSDSTSKFKHCKVDDNPIGLSYLTSDTPNNSVYIVKAGSGFHKIQITGRKTTGEIGLKIDVLNGTSATEYSFLPKPEYDFSYISLTQKSGVNVAPPAADWDVKFGRTSWKMGSKIGGRSSVSINSISGVTVSTVSSAELSEVKDVSELSYVSDQLHIGAGWYDYDNANRVFNMIPNVYVVKTAAGQYAKFKMLSFKGPNKEYFHPIFKYSFLESGSLFDQ